ncbi:MAG: hypothetical protein KF682_16645 [Nitrospira sp.]|nr:hypothetical protein [Nitrospira sp.]
MHHDQLNPHFLSYDYLTCSEHHQVFTTQAARCTCGWTVWTPTSDRAEVDELHNVHLKQVQARAARTFAFNQYRQVSRHTLRWRGPAAAQCDGCSWSVFGMDSQRITDAFNAHKERIKLEQEP